MTHLMKEVRLIDKERGAFESSLDYSSLACLDSFLEFFETEIGDEALDCPTCETSVSVVYSFTFVLENGTRLSGEALGDNCWAFDSAIHVLKDFRHALADGQWPFDTPPSPIVEVFFSEWCSNCLNLLN